MYTTSVFAVTGALVAAVAAVPMADMHHHHHARDYVWVTKFEEDIVTIPVTKTVWVEPGETPPTYSAPDVSPAGYPHWHSHSSAESAPAYTPETSPVESSTSSVYVAPTTSTSTYVAPTTSTSVYVAPTTSTSVYVAPAPSSSTSSGYVAPTTSTSVYVAPSTYVAPTTYAAPTTSTAAAPASTSASSGSSGSGATSGVAAAGTDYTGDLTWYDVGLGACGWTNTADEPIVAISESIFDAYSTGNPNTNPLCGKYVTITGTSGSPYKAKIVDRCTGCKQADLDLSEDFFNTVTNNGNGRVSGMAWCFD